MKWNCDLIQDLLTLYEEGLCSPPSRAAVEEHLAECESCRRLSKPISIPEPETPQADRAVAKGIRTVKRRWRTSLVAALLIVPLLLLSVNQFRGSGVCFTNLDDILTARRFLSALEDGDWDAAARLHNYSDDYESILEALNLSEADWGPRFTPVTIEGEPYMLTTYAAQLYGVPGTAADLFGYLYNGWGSVMISPALWEQVCAADDGAIIDLGGERQELNGEAYAQVTTPWGEFVISEGKRCDTAAEYATRLDLIPAAVYEEAKPTLDTEAKEVYSATHASYDYVAEMTEEEFIAYMEESYAADLRALEDTVTFDCTGYQGGYRFSENDGWHIQFGVTITYQGESLQTTMAISTEDGRVEVASLSHREKADWLYELETALYPSAHPDY